MKAIAQIVRMIEKDFLSVSDDVEDRLFIVDVGMRSLRQCLRLSRWVNRHFSREKQIYVSEIDNIMYKCC